MSDSETSNRIVSLVPGDKWRNTKTGEIKAVVRNQTTGKWGLMAPSGKFLYWGAGELKTHLRKFYEPYEEPADSEPESAPETPEKPPINLVAGSRWRRKSDGNECTLIKNSSKSVWALLFDDSRYYPYLEGVMKKRLQAEYEQICQPEPRAPQYDLYNGARFETGISKAVTIFGCEDTWFPVFDGCPDGCAHDRYSEKQIRDWLKVRKAAQIQRKSGLYNGAAFRVRGSVVRVYGDDNLWTGTVMRKSDCFEVVVFTCFSRERASAWLHKHGAVHTTPNMHPSEEAFSAAVK